MQCWQGCGGRGARHGGGVGYSGESPTLSELSGEGGDTQGENPGCRLREALCQSEEGEHGANTFTPKPCGGDELELSAVQRVVTNHAVL